MHHTVQAPSGLQLDDGGARQGTAVCAFHCVKKYVCGNERRSVPAQADTKDTEEISKDPEPAAAEDARTEDASEAPVCCTFRMPTLILSLLCKTCFYASQPGLGGVQLSSVACKEGRIQ